MEIVNEYSDEGKSGKSVEGRPEFQRMLDNIARKKQSRIVPGIWNKPTHW